MSGGATARLFLAVDPPEQVCLELSSWARTVAASLPGEARGRSDPDAGRGARRSDVARGRHGRDPRPQLRVLPAEALHITLCFLGSRPVEEIDTLVAVPCASTTEVGELSVGAPLWLPPRRPGNLAVEIHDEDGELERLQRELAGELERVVGWEPGRRRFRAHLTVARVRGREPLLAGPGDPAAVPVTPALRFQPESVTLYRSFLEPSGARYEALASRPLGRIT
ncbi:MAG TPA: RNA 2',3'-cyclic phosphodiesterase [Solirubrobacteraceae bacterium]|nr:RNA 2',3'-cyclic phosphodiesterase [Solirubrobacteraceae bacterium]